MEVYRFFELELNGSAACKVDAEVCPSIGYLDYGEYPYQRKDAREYECKALTSTHPRKQLMYA